jgi:putative ABC transport system permease protein
MSIIKLAFKNVLARPINLVISVILFALGIGLIGFLLLFQDQIRTKFESNLAGIDLVVGAKGSPLQLILCNMYHIDNPTGNIKIKDASPFFRTNHPVVKKAVPLSLGDNYKTYRIIGTTHEILDLYKAKLVDGKLWDTDLEVVIGKEVAEKGQLKVGDKFNSSHGFTEDVDLAHDEFSFKVTGIVGATGTVLDQLILTNTSSVWLVHEKGADSIVYKTYKEDNTFEGLLKYPDRDITSMLIQYRSKTNYQALNLPRNINENTAMQAASPAFEISKLFNLIGVGTQALKWIGIIIGFVSALSIFLSLYRSLKERKYELALIRAMGANKSKVFWLILLEGLIYTIIGWIVGTLLSHLGMEIMATYLKNDFKYSFTGLTWLKEEWIILGVAIVIGIVSAIIPAYKASKEDIHLTLTER